MNVDRSQILEDLLVFADLGTEPPRVHQGDPLVVRMFRRGEELELRFHGDGAEKVIEHSLDTHVTQTHASYHALLASERWGNLREWPRNQKTALRQTLSVISPRIPVIGSLSNSDVALDIEKLDDRLDEHEHKGESVHVTLIDGPAGIGKTTFISSLALSRAETYQTIRRRPLILHVQSRGRVLTYLQDMIAFSLQKLRLAVTFDQLPVLVRRGLVILAIDGFDELADPNGYDLAWGQINDLVDQVRGHGTLILAGRETFIGLERIQTRLTSLTKQDDVDLLSLEHPDPTTAKDWLKKKKWSDEGLRSAEALFEPGSYALRPFFLSQFADPGTESSIGETSTGSLLGFLVQSMIDREADKLGDAVAKVLDEDKRRDYLLRLLCEVARSMADDGMEAIDEHMLAWSVDAAAVGMPSEIVGLLKHRAPVTAFMEKDDAPNYRRFTHSQIYHYFLGLETIALIVKREIPKYVRRNIMGAEFLTTFSDVLAETAGSDPDRISAFFRSACHLVEAYAWVDQGVRNLGAYMMATLPAMEGTENLSIRGLDIDEATIQGTAPPAEIHKVVMNQLDIRGSDIREMTFAGSTVVTLVVDDATRVPVSFPDPARLQYAGTGGKSKSVITDPEKITKWLDKHGRSEQSDREDHGLVPSTLRDHPLLTLLGRVCRSKPYWIPLVKKAKFQDYVEDPWWRELLGLLESHNLVRRERKSVSGKKTDLVHVKRSKDILIENSDDDEIRKFYKSLVERLDEESS